MYRPYVKWVKYRRVNKQEMFAKEIKPKLRYLRFWSARGHRADRRFRVDQSLGKGALKNERKIL